MPDVTVLIFHLAAGIDESPLVRLLSDVREQLVERHTRLFRRAGATDLRVITERQASKSFGEVLAALAPARGGAIVLSGGAVPFLNLGDARRLVAAAAARGRVALTNNRYSSDVCAVSHATTLRELPPLPSDNALPRWLEELRGYEVSDLPGRDRLGLDLDTPLDVALAALARTAPAWLRNAAADGGLAVPRLAELRALATDPLAELLVFGRSGSRTLRWLETNVRCRVRFLAEERGLRAASPLAIGDRQPQIPNGVAHDSAFRGPRATLGLMLDERGPESLAEVVGDLADGAIVDSRVLLAHRLGPDESRWPPAADRFASDLHRPDEVRDPWLKALTQSAATSRRPIVMGGHSLVGPGVSLLFG